MQIPWTAPTGLSCEVDRGGRGLLHAEQTLLPRAAMFKRSRACLRRRTLHIYAGDRVIEAVKRNTRCGENTVEKPREWRADLFENMAFDQNPEKL